MMDGDRHTVKTTGDGLGGEYTMTPMDGKLKLEWEKMVVPKDLRANIVELPNYGPGIVLHIDGVTNEIDVAMTKGMAEEFVSVLESVVDTMSREFPDND